MKITNEAVDQVRRLEARTNLLLKGTRYIFYKNDFNLTETKKAVKEKLSLVKLNPESMREICTHEAFQLIYIADSVNEFKNLLSSWYYWAHSQLQPIIKAAKRKARGYKKPHFKTIAYLITGKLDFTKANPNCFPT